MANVNKTNVTLYNLVGLTEDEKHVLTAVLNIVGITSTGLKTFVHKNLDKDECNLTNNQVNKILDDLFTVFSNA